MSALTRSPFLAALLGLVAPGVGHLYVGRAARFLIPALAMLVVLTLLGVAGALSTFTGALTYVAMLTALVLFGIVDPVLVAKRTKVIQPKWYTHWYAYLGWAVLALCAVAILIAIREPVLGYAMFRAPGISMAPAIAPREIILVDTRAARERMPSEGEVVVVRGPKTGLLFIRRVSKVLDVSRISLASDNPESRPYDAEFESVPSSHVLGRVTYVFYSPTMARIGSRVN